jgi:hypothetical protein
MFSFHVIINLLDSSVPSLDNVSFLIHLGEDLILFSRARDYLIDLVIIWYFTLLLPFIIISIVLSDQVFESFLPLHIRSLIIEHTSLNDLIVEVFLHCSFIEYAFFNFGRSNETINSYFSLLPDSMSAVLGLFIHLRIPI